MVPFPVEFVIVTDTLTRPVPALPLSFAPGAPFATVNVVLVGKVNIRNVPLFPLFVIPVITICDPTARGFTRVTGLVYVYVDVPAAELHAVMAAIVAGHATCPVSGP